MNRRTLFLLTALASLPTLSPAQDGAVVKATTPEEKKDGGWQGRHHQFNEVSKKGEAELVFLGDSITQGWEGSGKETWNKYYAQRKAANFGISGDRTEHVLWRLDHGNFDGLKPKLIVIMIGTNNTGHRMDPADQTAAGIKAILDRLDKKCPQSKVLLLGVFPCGEKPDEKRRVRNGEINALIAKLADGKKVVFKDITQEFLTKDGALPKDIMPDALHPNAKGYAIWAEAIEEDVAKLLGEKK